MMVLAIVLLAAGTYGFRVAGPLQAERVRLSESVRELVSTAATVLLCALVATATVVDGGGFAGWALPAGVLAGGLLAWFRAPFYLVVIVAAATTAGLRLLGVS